MPPIPRMIHQIWIGDKPAPREWIQTWKDKNPEFEHILWTESEFVNRNFIFKNQEKIDLCQEICGKTDIMRLEILYQYGGIFIDADSICIEPIEFLFENEEIGGFATYENENFRKWLIANGNIAFIPEHPLLCDMIEWIHSEESVEPITTLRAWGSVGPVLFTRFLNTGKYPDIQILPSYTFLPIHFTGTKYDGHRKVYAHQLWGSNYGLYDKPHYSLKLPRELESPDETITLCIFLNNTFNVDSLKYMLNSIKYQRGYFNIDCIFILDEVFINRKKEFERFENLRITSEKTSRFIKIRNLSKTEFEELEKKIKYINIFPNCILYPDSLKKIIEGNIVTVPLYSVDNGNKCIVLDETVKIHSYETCHVNPV